MKLTIILLLLVIILVSFCESKRSRGRSRGSSGGSSFWNRKSKSSAEPKPAAIPPKPVQPKPAPKEPEIKKQNANVQQSAPPQNTRPIGWDVNNNNNMQKQNVNPSHSAPNPHNPGYPQNTGGNPGYGQAQPHGGYGQAPPPYGAGGVQHSYGQAPPPYSPSGAQHSYGQAPPPYSAGGAQHNYAQPPPAYPGVPQNNMGGYNYGSHHGYNNYGQPPPAYPGVPQNNMGGYGYGGGYPQQTGMMGSFLGGKKHGFGGYGGYGGVGALGYGYGMKKSGGFFGKHAFRNVLGGLFVWYLVSGLISTPYKVYNFYNQPKEFREEIKLPANVLTLCNENATNICVPGTVAICTQDNQILCVTSMTKVSPCQENNGELCVNSTIPCIDANDPLCQNKSTTDNSTNINLPCFTNMTLDTSQTPLPSNLTLPTSENNKFCVTTMAVPDPTIPAEEGKPPELVTDQTGLNPINATSEQFNATLPIGR